MKLRIFNFLIILLLIVNISYGQDINRVGTSAAQFLKIGVGARANAMGEAFVSFPGEVTGLYWNPSGIASIEHTSFAISRTELYTDIAYNFIGIVQPLGSNNILGISILYLDSGNMEVTTLDQPQGTGKYYSWESYCIGITYARFVTDRLRLGGTIKYISEGAYHQKATSLAIDIGSLLDTGVLGMKLGMSLSNLGWEMHLTGTGLNTPQSSNGNGSETHYNTDNWPLPLIFRLGLSMELVGKKGQLFTNASNKIVIAADTFDPNDANLKSNMGFEYEWNNIFALRAGYHGLCLERDYYDAYNTASYTFGAGFKHKTNAFSAQIDYAYTDMKILGTSHIVTLKFIL